MLWVRYTVLVLLVIFVTLSVAANVLPYFRFRSNAATGELDSTAGVMVHTSTFYLWYHEVQLATDPASNGVEFPDYGVTFAVPGKMKLILRVVASNMRNFALDSSGNGGPSVFSHVLATCTTVGHELMAASAMSVLSTVLGGVALLVVAWGRGPADSCLVPGWVTFTLTALAAMAALVAVALTAHVRANPLCSKFVYAHQDYNLASGFVVQCIAFAGYVVTAMIQAMCPMCCCCCDCGLTRLDDDYDDTDVDQKTSAGNARGCEVERPASSTSPSVH